MSEKSLNITWTFSQFHNRWTSWTNGPFSTLWGWAPPIEITQRHSSTVHSANYTNSLCTVFCVVVVVVESATQRKGPKLTQFRQIFVVVNETGENFLPWMDTFSLSRHIYSSFFPPQTQWDGETEVGRRNVRLLTRFSTCLGRKILQAPNYSPNSFSAIHSHNGQLLPGILPWINSRYFYSYKEQIWLIRLMGCHIAAKFYVGNWTLSFLLSQKLLIWIFNYIFFQSNSY